MIVLFNPQGKSDPPRIVDMTMFQGALNLKKAPFNHNHFLAKTTILMFSEVKSDVLRATNSKEFEGATKLLGR